MTQNDLNDLTIPLAELRMLIVDLIKNGIYEAPLGDFLLLLKPLVKHTEKDPA